MKSHRTTLEAAKNPIPGDPAKGDGYWVNLKMVDQIRERCATRRFVKHIGLFFALNWVMSDYKSAVVHVTTDHLGKLTGLRPSVVLRLLNDLHQMEVIEVEQMRGPSAIEGLVKITMLGPVRI
jgi:hypothetical protein